MLLEAGYYYPVSEQEKSSFNEVFVSGLLRLAGDATSIIRYLPFF